MNTRFAFQPAPASWTVHPATRPPEPSFEPHPEPLPEREWGLSAGQVVIAVLAIVAACQAIGVLFPG